MRLKPRALARGLSIVVGGVTATSTHDELGTYGGLLSGAIIVVLAEILLSARSP